MSTLTLPQRELLEAVIHFVERSDEKKNQEGYIDRPAGTAGGPAEKQLGLVKHDRPILPTHERHPGPARTGRKYASRENRARKEPLLEH